MSFIQALFLLGAMGVAGPIAAHLLARPRYRRVPFTMMRFLRSGETETQSRRQLKNLLVLLLRCAIMVLLALFFAGPERLLVTSQAAAPVNMFIAIDDSLSMAYGDTMARAVADARRTIAGASGDARFHVFALASGKTIRDATRAQAEVFVGELEPVPLQASMVAYAGAIRSSSKTGSRTIGHLVSDFTPAMRDGFASISEPIPVDAYTYTRVGPDSTPANIAIENAHVFPGADGGIAVSISVANYGTVESKASISASIAGGAPVTAQAQLQAGAHHSIQLQLPFPVVGGPFVPIEITAARGDGMPQDDCFRAGLAGPEAATNHVLVVGTDDRELFLLKTAVETIAQANALAGITVQSITHAALDANTLRNATVAIFASAPEHSAVGVEASAAFVNGGGRLIAFTNRDVNAGFYASLADAGILPGVPGEQRDGPVRLVREFGSVTMGDPMSPDGAAIRALRNYRLERMPVHASYSVRTVGDAQPLWTFEDGAAFLLYKACGRGSSVLVNTSADDSLSPLMKSPAAVAFVSYLLGAGVRMQQLAFRAGETVQLPASEFELAHAAEKQTFPILLPDGKDAFAECVNGTLTVPGVNALGWVSTRATPVRSAGINVPEGETDLSVPSTTRQDLMMQQVFTSREHAVLSDGESSGQERKPLWRGIGWAALALIVVDVFVSNRVAR